MEKQIIIKHSCSDKIFKIKNIISYLELFADSSKDKIVFHCCLNANQSKIIDKITNLKHVGDVDMMNIETSKNHHKFDIATSLDYVVGILDLIEKYELNVMIRCNDIKMFINDNDGDFIIINSSHKKYKTIKNN